MNGRRRLLTTRQMHCLDLIRRGIPPAAHPRTMRSLEARGLIVRSDERPFWRVTTIHERAAFAREKDHGQ